MINMKKLAEARQQALKLRRRPVKQRWLGILLALYVAVLMLVSLSSALGPERWWWSSLNLYLPQWIWGIPGALFLPITWRLAKRWVWLPLLTLFWVAVALMGFCWHITSSAKRDAEETPLRIMTYNVEYGRQGATAIINEIRRAHPDLLLLQDCRDNVRNALEEKFPSWNIRYFGQYVIASRYPLSDAKVGSLSFSGENHTYLRCRMQLNTQTIALYNVHLLTPREGLAALRHGDIGGISLLQRNVENRVIQASRLADDLRRETGAVLLAGDLNAPTQSLVCRQLFQTRLHDAFAEAGWGYGYTYGHSLRLGSSYTRLDHILTSVHWRVQRCWTESGAGSDHRPVIAELALLSN